MNGNQQPELRYVIAQFLAQSQTPGAAVAVRINTQIFLETGIGYEDRDRQIPLAKDARFYI
ncbi:MAG: serine hydrolase [Cyanobacteriota bacterium]|nr:serine hydrolase [Cyanobacteriota bacterium]